MNNKYLSPVTGEELFLGDDGLLHSKFNNMLYATDSLNNVILLKSPINGKPLYRDLSGYFKCEGESYLYEIKDGAITVVNNQSINNDIKSNIDLNNNYDTISDSAVNSDSLIVNNKVDVNIDDFEEKPDTSLIDLSQINDSNVNANASIETVLVIVITILLLISISAILVFVF